jgi:hypothetical protein
VFYHKASNLPDWRLVLQREQRDTKEDGQGIISPTTAHLQDFRFDFLRSLLSNHQTFRLSKMLRS